MPSSLPDNMHLVLQLLSVYNPKTILECGCGFGKYGVLIREYFDVNRYGQIKKDNWFITLDTIEGFEDYISPLHKYIYDNIIIGDFTKKIDDVTNYDLCLLVDVVEHLEKEKAHQFLSKVLTHCKFALIVVPDYDYKQGPVFGNDYETHRSVWEFDDFARYKVLGKFGANRSLFLVITNKKGYNLLERGM